ncbi:MSMEG_6728 family protein [Vallicoccus soli]|uniref:MSMEG_6728 family protein n=1 Tax=Vallicoccus soli TaxID=2339232 RepID=UPI0015AD7DB5|nr:MSMEG_6728 family protein [Vallicoccus soli]
MQTFLTHPDFRRSAASLDDRRLGKQRVETLQILRALTWTTYGWRNHPAVRMWRGFVPALVAYGVATVDEWESRGRADATRTALADFAELPPPSLQELHDRGQLPPWLGLDALHVSHRSALVRKDPDFYRPLFPDVPDDLPYLWPKAAFPRWPLRRGHERALDLYSALALLGHDEPTPEQRAALDAVRDGDSYRLELAPGAGATTAGLLAGLCTPGTTLWVAPGPALGDWAPHPGPAPADAPPGKLSTSIARPPTPEDSAAMAAEVTSAPEFRFLRPGQPAGPLREGAGLVVLDDGVEEPPPDAADLPVLRLSTTVALEQVVDLRVEAGVEG